MTSKELAEEIRSIITYLCEVSGKQDKYALECCDELDNKLEVLEQIKELTKSNPDLEEEILLSSRLEGYQKIRKWLEDE